MIFRSDQLNEISYNILLPQNSKEKFQKKILNERIARLSDGIAIIQVRSGTS